MIFGWLQVRALKPVAVLLPVMLAAGAVSSLGAQLRSEAGFYELGELEFYFHTGSYFNRLALRSSPARIWYVFQPAEEDAAAKPLFVFFNGGPGGATSAGLFSANTGRQALSVDPATGEASIIPCTSSWAQMGNLLYIDSRTAGFSYSLMMSPGNDALRIGEFDTQNYNCFIDGADFVRIVLRFLADHSGIQGNRVVIAAESYGGIRSLCMLHLLLYYQIYADGQALFQSPSLVEEIQNHYDDVFPAFQGRIAPPDIIADQFSHLILIQAAVSRSYQRLVAGEMLETEGSIIYQLAEETGVPFTPWREIPGNTWTPTPYEIMSNIYDYLELIGRDPYLCKFPDGYTLGFFAAAARLLTHYPSLNRMIGVDAAGIPELYASARQQAYKSRVVPLPGAALSALNDPPLEKRCLLAMNRSLDEDDLKAVFGILPPWDHYFLDLNYDVSLSFALNKAEFLGYLLHYTETPLYGRMFLENTAWVETFFTNADYDIVVYSPSLPQALAIHSDKLVSSIHDAEGPSGAARPGQIHLTYRENSIPGSTVRNRTIRFPRYRKSGHAVTLTEYVEMRDDVRDWLEATGVMEISKREENGDSSLRGHSGGVKRERQGEKK